MLATQTENRHRSSGPYPVPVPPAIATKDLLVAYGDAVVPSPDLAALLGLQPGDTE